MLIVLIVRCATGPRLVSVRRGAGQFRRPQVRFGENPSTHIIDLQYQLPVISASSHILCRRLLLTRDTLVNNSFGILCRRAFHYAVALSTYAMQEQLICCKVDCDSDHLPFGIWFSWECKHATVRRTRKFAPTKLDKLRDAVQKEIHRTEPHD